MGDVAEHLGVNRSTLFRQFRKTFDMAPKKYKDFVRLRKAAWLLANSNLLGKEVATACGYTDVNYFCRAFKKLQGLSPQQYRQRSRAIPRLAGRKEKVS